MFSFIVSGYVPGTSVQLTFKTWLFIMALLPFTAYLLRARLQRYMRDLAGNETYRRQPLHANQLHLRAL